MPDQESYEQQLRILQAHRRTLAHYLEQKASFSVGHVPAHIAAGIQEARQEVATIKRVIREWGFSVDDNPMDGDNIAPSVGIPPPLEIIPPRQEVWPQLELPAQQQPALQEHTPLMDTTHFILPPDSENLDLTSKKLEGAFLWRYG